MPHRRSLTLPAVERGTVFHGPVPLVGTPPDGNDPAGCGKTPIPTGFWQGATRVSESALECVRLIDKCPPVSDLSGRASLVTVRLGKRPFYCLSYTEMFVNFLPSESVPLVVTVRVLPSADTRIWPLSVTFPPFFAVNRNVWSLTFFNDRVSELGSPVTG